MDSNKILFWLGLGIIIFFILLAFFAFISYIIAEKKEKRANKYNDTLQSRLGDIVLTDDYKMYIQTLSFKKQRHQMWLIYKKVRDLYYYERNKSLLNSQIKHLLKEDILMAESFIKRNDFENAYINLQCVEKSIKYTPSIFKYDEYDDYEKYEFF